MATTVPMTAATADHAAVRITELANELTTDIDTATCEGIVRLLGASDAQLFTGYRGLPGVLSAPTLVAMSEAASAVAATLATETGIVVTSGSGTSGRLAFLASRAFNAYLARNGRGPRFHYLIAGGDHALIKAKEGAEDDPDLAMRDLKALLERTRPERVVLFGVSCSMSATYVRSQIAHAIDTDSFLPVILGFNPVAAAKPPPKSTGGGDTALSRDVVAELGKLACPADAAKGIVINPAVGPEPIAGSTRMKGGSATKMILEAVFAAGISAAYDFPLTPAVSRSLGRLAEPVRPLVAVIRAYAAAVSGVYLQTESIAKVVDLASESLRAGGRIIYIGGGAAALIGLVDASECPPTYGAAFTDVRGFVDGETAVDNREESVFGTGSGAGGAGAGGGRPDPYAEVYRFRVADFRRATLPTLTANDTVIAVGIDSYSRDVVEACSEASAAGVKTASVIVRHGAALATDVPLAFEDAAASVVVDIDDGQVLEGVTAYAELALKLVLNAVTTGAHVRKGTIYQNRMINLMVTNRKLFHRAVGIIDTFSKVGKEEATTCLLRAIYATDEVTAVQRAASVQDHVTAAAAQRRIVPLALLLARLGDAVTVAAATDMIHAEPVLRNLVC